MIEPVAYDYQGALYCPDCIDNLTRYSADPPDPEPFPVESCAIDCGERCANCDTLIIPCLDPECLSNGGEGIDS